MNFRWCFQIWVAVESVFPPTNKGNGFLRISKVFMLVTLPRCWWPFLDVGDKTKWPYPSPASQNGHQHVRFSTSDTNIISKWPSRKFMDFKWSLYRPTWLRNSGIFAVLSLNVTDQSQTFENFHNLFLLVSISIYLQFKVSIWISPRSVSLIIFLKEF